MRAEYEFSAGIRGKYARRARTTGTIVMLDPDVAASYPDSRSVNRALRKLIKGRSRPD